MANHLMMFFFTDSTLLQPALRPPTREKRQRKLKAPKSMWFGWTPKRKKSGNECVLYTTERYEYSTRAPVRSILNAARYTILVADEMPKQQLTEWPVGVWTVLNQMTTTRDCVMVLSNVPKRRNRTYCIWYFPNEHIHTFFTLWVLMHHRWPG